MTETLEQMALRIGKEVDALIENVLYPVESWRIEFARRLLGEQQKQEPVAKISRFGSTGMPECAWYDAYPPIGTELYAAPPQDALDAKRWRFHRATISKAIGKREDQVDAAIDTAMKEPK